MVLNPLQKQDHSNGIYNQLYQTRHLAPFFPTTCQDHDINLILSTMSPHNRLFLAHQIDHTVVIHIIANFFLFFFLSLSDPPIQKVKK